MKNDEYVIVLTRLFAFNTLVATRSASEHNSTKETAASINPKYRHTAIEVAITEIASTTSTDGIKTLLT